MRRRVSRGHGDGEMAKGIVSSASVVVGGLREYRRQTSRGGKRGEYERWCWVSGMRQGCRSLGEGGRMLGVLRAIALAWRSDARSAAWQ